MNLITTNGADPRFAALCQKLDEYLNDAVGGEKQRSQYIQYNQLQDIHDVVLILEGEEAVAAGSFKEYDAKTVELKRIFVSDGFRGRKYGQQILSRLEAIARKQGYTRAVLETGNILTHARKLYLEQGFEVISNYGPYVNMKESVCMEKLL